MGEKGKLVNFFFSKWNFYPSYFVKADKASHSIEELEREKKK